MTQVATQTGYTTTYLKTTTYVTTYPVYVTKTEGGGTITSEYTTTETVTKTIPYTEVITPTNTKTVSEVSVERLVLEFRS